MEQENSGERAGSPTALKQNWRALVWLFLMIAMFAIIIFVATRGSEEEVRPPYVLYSQTDSTMQNAVLSYKFEHNGSLPLLNISGEEEGIDIGLWPEGGVTAHIIDACTLLDEGHLQEIPPGVKEIEGEDEDNCDGGNCTCRQDAHYVWLVDEWGYVYSVCLGDGCWEGMQDGYQGVWP